MPTTQQSQPKRERARALKHVQSEDTLDNLLSPKDKVGAELDVHSIDVRRLRDDNSPIDSGEEVMFVAVCKFHLVEKTAGVEAGQDVLEIRSDADLVSGLEIVKESDIQAALERDFDFVFSVDGKKRPNHQIGDDPPWIFRFNTAPYASDYVKVEVDVVKRPRAADPVDPAEPVLRFRLLESDQKRQMWMKFKVSDLLKARGHLSFTLRSDDADVDLPFELELDGDLPGRPEGEPDDDADD